MRTPIPTKLTVNEKQTRLTPSEVIFFNAPAFTAKGDLNLPHLTSKVSGQQLGKAMLIAALLAAEQIGNLRLELRPVKGLLKQEVLALFVAPLEAGHKWPSDTLEAQLHALAHARMVRTGSCQANRLICDLLGQSDSSPWQRAIDLVMQGLAIRGLLETEASKRFPKLTHRRNELPVKTQLLLNRQPYEPVKHLLTHCREERPAVWHQLIAQISKGVKGHV